MRLREFAVVCRYDRYSMRGQIGMCVLAGERYLVGVAAS